MQHKKLFQPDYSNDFRCIGPACEDSCCGGWTIYVDQGAFEKYQTLPAGPLRTIIDENILRTPATAPGTGSSTAATFAQIRMNTLRHCPLLSAEGLCLIQAEHGAGFLSHACAHYPRITYCIDGVTEKALSLSCPEAARRVLLHPRLLTSAGRDGDPPMGDDRDPRSDPWLAHFWRIRDFALALVQNRVYSLWQRLFLLDLFSRRFDAIAADQHPERVPQLLAKFEAAIASGNLQAAMNNLPADHARQLDLVLQLAGMLLHESPVRPRFVECIQAFTQGIGNGPGATLESLTAHYALAHDRYYAPFFQKHPHILENYLINTIFRCRFPFGRDWVPTGSAPLMIRESAFLSAQYALIKGLLIGVAGFHRKKFSARHVVHTVQAASKHFEHHTEFSTRVHTLLVETRMEGELGMAMMLRNSESHAALAFLAGDSRSRANRVDLGFSIAPPARTDPHLPEPATR